jgi:hypothetical protein
MKNNNTPLYILFGLVIITIILIFIKNNNIKTSEGFAKETGYLEGCPVGFKSYIVSNGDIMCCDGEIIGEKCIGGTQCVLSSKRSGNVESCMNIVVDANSIKAKEFCPPSMKTYFIDKKKGAACTSEVLNNTKDGLAVQRKDSKVCYVYKDDISKFVKDSCYNQKELEKIECFGKSCVKGIENIERDVFTATLKFTTSNGLVLLTVPKNVVENYIKILSPNEAASPAFKTFLDSTPLVMENAKAYFVDRTREFKDW